VTIVGYQKGARQIAEANRIRLVRVNRLIQKIVVNTTIKMPRIENIRLDVDQDDANKKLRAAGRERVEYNPSGPPNAIRFCDEAGQDTISVEEIISTRSLDVGDQELALQGTFIKTDIGPIRLQAMRFTIRHDAMEESSIYLVRTLHVRLSRMLLPTRHNTFTMTALCPAQVRAQCDAAPPNKRFETNLRTRSLRSMVSTG
jgi:hypothetical protein